MPRPVIACANTVGENMGIRTTGELVEKCREGVMEFLLINHPLDCPICDQAGECRLQEFSVEHGKGQSRFKEEKIKKPKNVKIGPRIRLDDERCIMCSRCIRFMDEVADDFYDEDAVPEGLQDVIPSAEGSSTADAAPPSKDSSTVKIEPLEKPDEEGAIDARKLLANSEKEVEAKRQRGMKKVLEKIHAKLSDPTGLSVRKLKGTRKHGVQSL